MKRKFTVQAMWSDFHLANQPFWNQYFDLKEEAIVAAFKTWDWIMQNAPDGWHKPQLPSWEDQADCCVMVVDVKDELGERPVFIIGNWSATEG